MYMLKFPRERINGMRLWGFNGNRGPITYEDTVSEIAERGVPDKIRHYDKTPANYSLLDRKELLQLWKDVERAKAKGSQS